MSCRSSLLVAAVLCASLLLATSTAEPLQNQGRRLLTSFYTDPDTNYQSSTLVDVDTTYKSRSYTTETQPKKVEKKIKGSPSPVPSPTPSPSTAAVAAVQSSHSQLYHRGAHTAKVTSSDAIGGPIQLYNPYQSSDYDTKKHPASAAMDGDISTSSQTAVDTKSCTKLNEEGLYGTCGVIGECMSSPYYTGAYASTPNYPYWTAGFSSDISVSYRVTHVVLSARQDCCRCPLAGANIYVGDPSALNLASNENPDLSTESNWQLCATVPSFTTDSPPLIFSESADYTETFLCSQSLVGQAVAIQLPADTTILTLAEVQIVGLQTHVCQRDY
ncbi:hypothetical protein WJX82_011325 [Trebouxia sp. C0006]